MLVKVGNAWVETTGVTYIVPNGDNGATIHMRNQAWLNVDVSADEAAAIINRRTRVGLLNTAEESMLRDMIRPEWSAGMSEGGPGWVTTSADEAGPTATGAAMMEDAINGPEDPPVDRLVENLPGPRRIRP